MVIFLSNRFRRDLEKLTKGNPIYKIRLRKFTKLLQENINHPSLRLHKLDGSNNFSFSVDRSIRIIACLDGNTIFLLRIGTHDEVY